MFEVILELLFEFFGEFLLQLVLEVLLESGLQVLAAPFQKKSNPWLAAVGYALFGAAIGGLSLLVVGHSLVPASLRLANLLLTPLAVGGTMALLGAWRARRGQQVLRIDRFLYGYLFALTLGMVRYLYAG